MMLPSRPLRWAAPLLAASCSAPAIPVALDTDGGDAWTFQKLVTATVPAGACDSVEFASPAGAVIAHPRGRQVTARLDDLAALGIDVLWLSPITRSATGDFGYGVTDYFRVRSDFGAGRDLSELVAATHARGMRVILASGVTGMQTTFRFLNNNDTGARFVTRYGAARARVASAKLLTLPGLPSLYTGDDVGAEFEPYSEGPPLAWQDRGGWHDWYRRLIALRRRYPALRTGELRMFDVEPRDRVLAYVRQARATGDERGEDQIVVLLNYGTEPVRITLPTDSLPRAGGSGRLVDLLDGSVFAAQDRRGIPLASHGVRILRATAQQAR